MDEQHDDDYVPGSFGDLDSGGPSKPEGWWDRYNRLRARSRETPSKPGTYDGLKTVVLLLLGPIGWVVLIVWKLNQLSRDRSGQ
jgi:hypothetical protein